MPAYNINVVCIFRCPDFQGLPASCTLVEDPNDRCCQIPNCPSNVNGTTIIVPVPQYGPGFSGYGSASYQPGTLMPGPTGNGTMTGTPGTMTSFSGGSTGPQVTGGRS